MEEHGATAPGTRRDQDIALDLMKFIAVTTGYGRASTSPTAGFQWPANRKLRITRSTCWSCTDNV